MRTIKWTIKWNIKGIFAIALAIYAAILMIFFSAPIENVAGLAHPSISNMRIGGDGAARMQGIGPWAFILQSLTFALLIGLALLSMKRVGKLGLISLAFTFAMMIFIWSEAYFSHQAFLISGQTDYFLSLPTATAWAIYGFWLLGVPLMLLYCFGFRRFVLSDAEEAEFNALVEAAKQLENDNDANDRSNEEKAIRTDANG